MKNKISVILIVLTLLLGAWDPHPVHANAVDANGRYENEPYGFAIQPATGYQFIREQNTGIAHQVTFARSNSQRTFILTIQNFDATQFSSLEDWLNAQEQEWTGTRQSRQSFAIDGESGLLTTYQSSDGDYGVVIHILYDYKIYAYSLFPFESASIPQAEYEWIASNFRWTQKGKPHQSVPVLKYEGTAVPPAPAQNHSPLSPPTLQFPFCGTWHISNDYNGHTGQWSEWALDWVNDSGATWNAPIYAAHDGTVYNVWDSYGGGNLVKLQTSDGQYRTWYAHLNQFSVPDGTPVTTGSQIGLAGDSGVTSGAHLHFALLENRGGNWWSIVPEPMSGATGFTFPQQHTRDCSAPPPSGDVVTLSQPTTLNPGFPGNGNECSSGWHFFDGYDAYITLNVQSGAVSNYGIWQPSLPIEGNWKVEMRNPTHPYYSWPCWPYTYLDHDTSNAQYEVHHANGTQTVAINQQQSVEWLELGTFYFNAGTSGYVFLGDVTGEPSWTRGIIFSGMRFTLMDNGGGSGSGGGVVYNRDAAINWAAQNNRNDGQPYGNSEGRYCTTYVGRVLNAGGLNASTSWYGNQQIIQWMQNNPDAWEERPIEQLMPGDFILYSQYEVALANWDYIDPVGGWSWWAHSAVVVGANRVAAWNYEYYNLDANAYTSMPYRKGIHILDVPNQGEYQDQGWLSYGSGNAQTRQLNTTIHRWRFSANSGDVPLLLDLRPMGGEMQYALTLKNSAGQVIVATRSSGDGRGIISLENVTSGNYDLWIVPEPGANGTYEIAAYTHSIPRIDFGWGEQWAYSDVRRWQAWMDAPRTFYVYWQRTFGNIEIDWELRTRDGSLLSSGSSVNGQVLAQGYAPTAGWVDFWITRISTEGSYHINVYQNPPTISDVTMPTGSITSPINNQVFNYSNRTVTLTANASDNAGGLGVKRVVFWARYGAPYTAEWRLIGEDTSAPYQLDWAIPADLRSQLIEIGIHIEDNAQNYCIDPLVINGTNQCGYPESKRVITYLESSPDSNIITNWVPQDWRFYLNQFSLNGEFDQNKSKCNGAAAAMMLAMHGAINTDYANMQNTADTLYQALNPDFRASVLANYLAAAYPNVQVDYLEKFTYDAGWQTILDEINGGHPVMLLSQSGKMSTYGHYIVIVGYRQNGNQREVIAYDPYGHWTGQKGQFDTNTSAWDSFKGQWVYYNFNDVWGSDLFSWPWTWDDGFLITMRPQSLEITQALAQSVASSNNLPDLLIPEPEWLTTYQGITIPPEERYYIFLPLTRR